MDSLNNSDYQLIDILTYLSDEGIISDTVTSMEDDLVRKIKYREKEKFVLKNHLNLDGSPTKICPPKNENGLWYTPNPLNRKSKLRGASYEVLIDKLFDIYSKSTDFIFDTSFEAIFELALNKRATLRKLAPSTLNRYQSNFRTYFKSIKKNDITRADRFFLTDFLNNIVKDFNPTEKELKNIFGTLNLIFQFATTGSNKFMELNPMEDIDIITFIKGDYNASYDRAPDTPDIEKVFSQSDVEIIRNEAIRRTKGKTYHPHPYMILFASITGARTGEICALKWNDIFEYGIHFHSQIVDDRIHNGKDKWRLLNWTKDEKGISKGGRIFPFIDGVEELLNELKQKQSELNIKSEFVFAKADGSFTTPEDYRGSLLKLCRKLNLNVTNNHAFRKATNQRLEDEGYRISERSSILGHSPRVNQENYTKADNEFIRRSTEKYRKINGSEDFEQVTKGDQTIINFSSIRKKLQTQQLC